jgi:hypothetical protein
MTRIKGQSNATRQEGITRAGANGVTGGSLIRSNPFRSVPIRIHESYGRPGQFAGWCLLPEHIHQLLLDTD